MAASRVVVLLLMLCMQASPAVGALYLWRGVASGTAGADGHTFDLAANWSPSVIPTPVDIARFDLIAADLLPLQLLAPRSISTLEIAGTSASLFNSPQLSPQIINVGGSAGAGTLTLLSGIMASAQWRVGNSAAGTVNLQASGTVQASDAQIGISANGTLNIDGPDASWTHTGGALSLGLGANVGEVNVTNGGALTTAGFSGNRAKLIVDGLGSRWTDTGMITSNDGPTVSGGAHAETWRMSVFNTSSSGRTSLVTGQGSQWLMHSSAEIWRPGIAAENGGMLTTQAALIVDRLGFASVDGTGSLWNAHGNVLLLGTSNLFVQDHGVLNSTGSVFMNSGTRAQAGVSAGGEWHYSGPITLMGSSGFTSSIDVFSAGLLEGGAIGFSGNLGVGKVQVSGAGSRWHVTGSQGIGGSAPNQATAVAQIVVSGGGELDCDGTLSLVFGGSLEVSAGGFLKTDQLVLQPLTTGAFLFTPSGGIIRTNRLTLGGLAPQIEFGTFQLGHTAGLGSGLLTVAASTFIYTDRGVFGYDAPASVTISGTLAGTDMVVGDQPTGDGTVLVGSASHTIQDLTVGRQGRGLFQITSGTEQVGRDLMIGAEAGSFGTVTVGSGSLTVAGDAFVGGSRAGVGGAGMLKHTGNGTTTVTDTLFVFPSDTLLVVAGQLSASVINLMGGVLKSRAHITGKIINSGHLSCAPDNNQFTAMTLTGDLEQQSSGVLSLRVPSHTQHDSLLVSGVMTMAGTLELDMDASLSPQVGDHIRLATAGTFAGQFQSVIGVPAAVGLTHWSVKVEGGSLFLVGEQTAEASLPMTSSALVGLLALVMMTLGTVRLRMGRVGPS